jgi:hypothetical protein
VTKVVGMLCVFQIAPLQTETDTSKIFVKQSGLEAEALI